MKPPESLELVTLCCRTLDNKKAGEMRVLHVGSQSSITDFLIIATALSDPHLRALRVELEKVLDAAGVPIIGMESPPESGWTVVDLFEVMVHLFLAERRQHYRLENLWKDAEELSVPELLGEAKPKKPSRKPARPRAPAKKKAVAKKAPARKPAARKAAPKRKTQKKK